MNLKTQNFASLLYNVVFLGRRLIACLLIVFASNAPVAQLHIISFSSSAVVAYSLHVLPFTDKTLNVLDISNELSIAIICYFSYGFSGVLSDSQARYNVGWAVVAVFGANFVGNILFILAKVLTTLALTLSKLSRKLKVMRKQGGKIRFSLKEGLSATAGDKARIKGLTSS